MKSVTLRAAALLIAANLSVCSSFSSALHAQKNAAVGGFSTARFAVGRNRPSRNKNTLVMMPQGTPMVPYQAPGAEYAQMIDLYSRFYRERIMIIGNFIDEDAANNIIAILLYLKKEDPDKKIALYFNVPGALLRPALAVYDVICSCRETCDISTLNLGLATGMGAFLCGAGTKGMRCSMPNARFLLQRTGMDNVFQGQASDIGLEVQNVKKSNDRMEAELAKMTGQTLTKVRQDLRRDFYLSSEEAVAYGLIDHVLIPDSAKGVKEIRYERDSWTGEKIMIPDKEVDLGNFEGDDVQRYQDQTGGGWGSGWKDDDREGFIGDGDDGDDDDVPYEPPTSK